MSEQIFDSGVASTSSSLPLFDLPADHPSPAPSRSPSPILARPVEPQRGRLRQRNRDHGRGGSRPQRGRAPPAPPHRDADWAALRARRYAEGVARPAFAPPPPQRPPPGAPGGGPGGPSGPPPPGGPPAGGPPQRPPPAGPNRARNQFVLPHGFRLNAKQLAILDEDMPQFTTVPSDHLHPHPLLHTGRAAAEVAMLRRVVAAASNSNDPMQHVDPTGPRYLRLIDHGGSPSRHKLMGRRNIHCTCPELSPSDTARIADYPPSTPDWSWCTHAAQSCDCQPHSTESWACLFVHTLYYFSPPEVIELMWRTTAKRAFAVVHRFDQPSGHFYPDAVTDAPTEASWTLDETTGYVTMFVNGNLAPYVHPPASWLWTSPWAISDGTRTITWQEKGRVGRGAEAHYVFAFYATTAPIPVFAPLAFADALHSSLYTGPIDARALAATASGIPRDVCSPIEWAAFENTEFYSMGPHLWIRGSTTRRALAVPKGFVAELAIEAAGMSRCDARAWQALLMAAKTRARHDKSLTADQWADVIVPATVAAFLRGVRGEQRQFMHIAAQGPSLAVHGQLRDFSWATTVQWYYAAKFYALESARFFRDNWPVLLQIVGGVTVAGIALATVRHRPSVGLARVAPGFTLYGGLLAAGSRAVACLTQWIDWSAGWRAFTAVGRALAAFMRGAVGLQGTCMGGSHFDVDSECFVHMPPTPPCPPRTVAWLYGAAADYHPPTVNLQCNHNAYAAICGRMLFAGKVPWSDQRSGWRALCAHVTATEFPWVHGGGGRIPIEATPFDTWASRFPAPRRRDFYEARESLRDGGRTHFGVSLFVKIEGVPKRCPLASWPAYSEAASDRLSLGPASRTWPRPIQSRMPTFVVQTAPWIHAMGDLVASRWHWLAAATGNTSDPITHTSRITYASGLNARDLGAWLEAALARFASDADPPVCAENDVGQYDGSLRRGAMALEKLLFGRFRLPRHVFELVTRKRRGGRNRGPDGFGSVSYSLVYRRLSGDSWTSVMNSMINAAIHEYLDASHSIWMIVLGDDNALVGPASAVHTVAAAVRAFGPLHGLDFKFVVRTSPDDLEFCSGVFWHSTAGRLWGPKPGRVISKTFFSVRQYNPVEAAAWVRGVCMSMRNDVQHIPVLRVFVARLLALTHGLRAMAVDREHRIHAPAAAQPVEATWSQAARRYGCGVSDLVELEDWLSAHVALGAVLTHPLLHRICSIDVPLVTAKAPNVGLSVWLPEVLYDVFRGTYDWRAHQRLVPATAADFVHDAIANATRAYEHCARAIVNVVKYGWRLPIAVAEGVGNWIATLPGVPDTLTEPAAGGTRIVAGAILVACRYLFACCAAPILEEAFKRIPATGPFDWGAAYTILLSLQESRDQRDTTAGAILRVILHFWLRRLPYRRAVLIHSGINFVWFSLYLAGQLRG